MVGLFLSYSFSPTQWISGDDRERDKQWIHTRWLSYRSVPVSYVQTANIVHLCFFFSSFFFCSASSFSSIASSYLVVFSQGNIIRSHYFLNDDRIDDVYRLSLYNLLTIPTEICTEIQEYKKNNINTAFTCWRQSLSECLRERKIERYKRQITRHWNVLSIIHSHPFWWWWQTVSR